MTTDMDVSDDVRRLPETRDGEIFYPIFSTRASWVMVRPDDVARRASDDDLPTHRMHNSLDWFDWMPREGASVQDALREAADRWAEYPVDKKGGSPSDVKITAKYTRHGTWALAWFSHWTYDTFADDAAVIDSFSSHVLRAQQEIWAAERKGEQPTICLMGAEDRWRWCGRGQTDEHSDGKILPPCRCEHCRKLGVVRIDH